MTRGLHWRGRETELTWLRERWRHAHGGTGRLELLSGARGIGKTRLVAELATELHAQGIGTVYVGGAAPGDDSDAPLERARRAKGPALLVLDDLNRASTETMKRVADLAAEVRERSLLAVLAYRDDPPPAAVTRLARELERQGEERLALRPLDADGLREIAGLYAGPRAASAPVDLLLEATGGLPRRIHELVADWATGDAVQRVGARAGRTATRSWWPAPVTRRAQPHWAPRRPRHCCSESWRVVARLGARNDRRSSQTPVT